MSKVSRHWGNMPGEAKPLMPVLAATTSLHDHLADENAKLRAQIRELEKEKRELEAKLWRLD